MTPPPTKKKSHMKSSFMWQLQCCFDLIWCVSRLDLWFSFFLPERSVCAASEWSTWQRSKGGPVVFGWQSSWWKKQPRMPLKKWKQTGSYVVVCEELFPPCPPPPLDLDSGDRCPTAAPGALVSRSQKRKFVTHPSTSPSLWPVVMVTAGSEMAFHEEKKKKNAPTPLCLSAPFLWPVAPLLLAKDPLSNPQKNCGGRESSQGHQAPLLTGTTAARWWRAEKHLAASGLLVQTAHTFPHIS